MDLTELQRNWQRLGSEDPFYGVLSDPSRRGRKWNQQEFFQTGIDEIAELMEMISVRYPSLEKNQALDFGCAVGRLTQPLADHFTQVTGVDIADSMIELARQLNTQGERCRFVHNQRDDLSVIESASMDLVYTNMVLQHMEPRYAEGYIAEFCRVLKPGGLVVFQVPARSLDKTWRRLLKRLVPRGWLLAYRRLRYGADAVSDVEVEMHGIAPQRVRELLAAGGLELIHEQGGFYWGAKHG